MCGISPFIALGLGSELRTSGLRRSFRKIGKLFAGTGKAPPAEM